MKIKNKILLSAIMLSSVSFAQASIQENSIQQEAVMTNINDTKDVQDFVINAVQGLLPYKSQVTVSDVKIDEQGNFVATNVLVMSKEDGGMNIAINKVQVTGLDVDGKVNGDFDIEFSGVSITNLGAVFASSDAVDASQQKDALIDAATNSDPTAMIANNIGEAIYTISMTYDYQDKKLSLNVKSTNGDTKFIFVKADIDNVDLYDADVSSLGTEMMDAVGNGNLSKVDASADFSKVIKESTEQLLGKQSDYPTFVSNFSYDKKTSDMKVYANGKIAGKDFFKYNTYVKDVNVSRIKIKDLGEDYLDALGSAYINDADSMLDVDFKFDRKDFGVKSEMQPIFDALGKDSIDIKINTKHNYEAGKYNSEAHIVGSGLANLDLATEGVVDGKFALLPYAGISADVKEKDLYDCDNRLCIKSVDMKFTNDNMLQQLARIFNKDPNTTPEQILGSYGALLQLMALQQQDPFVRGIASSFAMFLQNPKSIEIKAIAKKPVNQNVVAEMIFEDINNLNKSNGISDSGNMQISGKQPQLDFFGNIDKIFDMNFYVNGSKARLR